MSSKSAHRAVFGGALVVTALWTWMVGTAADAAGEQLYDQHCRRCHGTEGRGTSQAPRLVPFKWSANEALELIRRPVCDMPPIPESAVSDAQVAQIVEYLKSIE